MFSYHVEYKTIDLTPSWSLNYSKKIKDRIDELNRLGSDGWILLTGLETDKHAIFMKIVCTSKESEGARQEDAGATHL